jgi:DeoR-like helix-turn-helix domain
VNGRRSEHFAAVPGRFIHNWYDGELGPLHVLIALDLVWRCHQARNTAGGIARVSLSELAEVYEVSEETIRRKLHDLHEAGWIDFEQPRRGPGPKWKIWLAGLALRHSSEVAEEPSFHRVSSPEGVPARKLISTGMDLEEAATPHEDWSGNSSEFPHEPSVQNNRRDETRREENYNPGTNENKENSNHTTGAREDEWWKARDGEWRSVELEPPAFPGEVVETRNGRP